MRARGISFNRWVAGYAVALAWLLALSAGHLFAREAKTITQVEVQQDQGVTRIILRGAEDPIYTAFMREDPPRLIIELPDVRFDGIETPMKVANGVVEDVTLAAFGDPRVSPSMARISIGLANAAEYELLPKGNELVIELRPMPGSPTPQVVADAAPPAAPAKEQAEEPVQEEQAEAPAAETEAPASDAPSSDEEPSEAVAEAAAPTPNAPQEPALAAAPVPSSQIRRVVAQGLEVEVEADGPIDNVDSFALDNPERLVVDFWGVKNAVNPARFKVESGAVAGVRVGQHQDKVRVVMDLRVPLASHRIEPTAKGVHIFLEEDAKVAEPSMAQAESVPAAPAPEAEVDTSEMPAPEAPAAEVPAAMDQAQPSESAQVAPESPAAEAPAMPETQATEAAASEKPVTERSAPSTGEPVWVKSVHFESLPGADRVVMNLEREVETRVTRPDGATVVVDLPLTRIGKDVERRVDTKEFGGPLELFSVFQTPDVPEAQVRVVLKRHGETEPRLRWESGRLEIELPHGAETAKASSTPESAPSAEPAVVTSEEAASGSSAVVETPVPPMAAAADVPARLPAPAPEPPAAPIDGDPFLDGPADPAAIDVLEEGGFNEEKSYRGRRISLDFKDADIGNILRLIAEVSDLNIIAGEEVEGKVTIRLVDVPWDQAMDVILMTKGLGFVRVGNVLRIAPIETLKLENEARLQERRAKEKLEDLVVKLQPVNYADVNEVEELVKRLLSARGSVNVDERTNTLIIKDIPSVIHEATALIKAIDTQTPQVLIEAKIVEATLNFSRSLGAVWGAGYNDNGSDGGDGEFRLADRTNDSLLGPVVTVGDGGQESNFTSSNPLSGILNGFLTLGVLGLDDHLQLDLQLQAAEENNKGKVISSPRVVTLDNREAVIKQGVAIKFTEITRDTVTTSFVDAVLELKVTPHITANRAIVMKIKVSRNAPQLSTASGDVVGIAKNETQTEALVQDGETMVLGGIYVVDNGKATTKFPFLADIPLLGTAFRSRSVTDARRELLIFVTPRIVTGPASDL